MSPHQIFLVLDAMTGQDAVNSAKAFHEQLAVDGVILTKFDSDTRGGAALSRQAGDRRADPLHRHRARSSDAIEESSTPSAWPGRILGMGDVVSPRREGPASEVSEEEADGARRRKWPRAR